MDERNYLGTCKFCENLFPTFEENPATFCSNSCAESSSYEDDRRADEFSDLVKEHEHLPSFKDLSELAKDKAIRNYFDGWSETHEDEPLTHKEIFDTLMDDDGSKYDHKGVLVFDYNL